MIGLIVQNHTLLSITRRQEDVSTNPGYCQNGLCVELFFLIKINNIFSSFSKMSAPYSRRLELQVFSESSSRCLDVDPTQDMGCIRPVQCGQEVQAGPEQGDGQ